MRKPNSQYERILFWQIIIGAAFTLAFILAALTSFAWAQDHRHPPQDEEIHLKFYRHWMMPDSRHTSCCHDEDCFPVQAKKVGSNWFARKNEGDPWIPIPPNKVDIGLADSPEVPDARAHLCGRPQTGGFTTGAFTVFCFAAGSGG